MMKFNSDKLEHITFTRSPRSALQSFYLSPDSSLIKSVDSVKDLGIMFDSDMSFSTHISEKCAKANKLCGYILRTFVTRSCVPLIAAYKSLVLPVMEYGFIVWHPHKLCLTRKLEQVQRNFTSVLYGLEELSYWERLKKLNIFSLERRRERYIILYTFKIILGIVPNPGIKWGFSDRRGRYVYSTPLQRSSSLRDRSFFGLCPQLYNCLPKSLRDLSTGTNTIKYKLDEFLRNIPDEPRITGYTSASIASNNSIVKQVYRI